MEMMYEYQAMDARGVEVCKQIEAVDSAAATHALRAAGLFVTKIEPAQNVTLQCADAARELAHESAEKRIKDQKDKAIRYISKAIVDKCKSNVPYSDPYSLSILVSKIDVEDFSTLGIVEELTKAGYVASYSNELLYISWEDENA
jgi:hypothetical protein